MSTKKIYLQPVPVRIWHWLNALGIVTLALTGAQIRYPEYVSMFATYRTAITLHNVAGIVVALSFSIWFFYYKIVAGSLVNIYVPKKDDLTQGLFRQAVFYMLAYFCGAPNPHHAKPDDKFNPLQKSAYLAVMFVIMPLVSLTGIFLMNVEPMRDLLFMLGGLKLLVGLHFLLACTLCAFLFTHVYLATLGKTSLAYVKPMWTGWEDEEEHGHEMGHVQDSVPAGTAFTGAATAHAKTGH
jgi:thiosulfate reductase cytochrome b subunit